MNAQTLQNQSQATILVCGPRLCRRPAAACAKVRQAQIFQVAVLSDAPRLVFDIAAVRNCRIAALLALTILSTHITLAAESRDQNSSSNLTLISVEKIWHNGLHNAFTDLIRFNDQWFCTFRESQAHVGGNGKIRVLVSRDAKEWKSAALVEEDGIDLRDPKLSITPDSRLMLNVGGSVYDGKIFKERQSRVSFSNDGANWTSPQRILEKGDWLWRVTWHDGKAYGVSYSTPPIEPGKRDGHAGMTAKLVATRDGVLFDTVTQLDVPGSPNETTLRFLKNGDCVALARREVADREAWIGVSHAPYQKWAWHSAGLQIGGPNFIVLGDGSLIASGRQYHAAPVGSKTVVGEMTVESVRAELTLPSGGDCSYPGMVWHEGALWVSYYSSHEGTTDIYLAKISRAPDIRK